MSCKIAMLQCDLADRHECHSYHFAPFMVDCDRDILKEVWPTSFYYHTHPQHPEGFFHAKPVEGFEIISVWDVQGRERAETFSKFTFGKARVCDSIEQALDGADAVFLADGGGDGSRHPEWVSPALQRGLPIYIDKPFADTYARGKAIIDLAEQSGTPFFATSILRYVPEVEHFRATWCRLEGEPGLAVIKGVGPSNGATIHGLSLMQGIFGTGINYVESVGEQPRQIMHVHYGSGLQVVVLNTPSDVLDWFQCEVWMRTQRRNPPPRIYAQSVPIGDPQFIPGAREILVRYKRMIETGEPPEPYDVPLELAATLEAGLRSHETRQRVHLREVMK